MEVRGIVRRAPNDVSREVATVRLCGEQWRLTTTRFQPLDRFGGPLNTEYLLVRWLSNQMYQGKFPDEPVSRMAIVAEETRCSLKLTSEALCNVFRHEYPPIVFILSIALLWASA
jgi:hypothetical protein